MSGSTIGIIVLVIVVVGALAGWLLAIRAAARRPGTAHPQQDEVRGVVQGGQHVGGGRSVAPTRDAPVPQGGGDPPSAPEQETAQREAAEQIRARRARRSGDGSDTDTGSGSPMNL